MAQVSPLAFVHPAAQLADDVVVEPFAVVQEDVVIGAGSWIGSHAIVHPGARIGRNCQIFPGAIISIVPQDLKFQNEYSTVELADNVIVREYATIHRGTSYSFKTVVGPGTLVMAYAHIAHDCIIGANVIIANAGTIAGHVKVDDFAVLGGMCAVHQFTHIGKHAIIAGGCIVRKDVPPYVLAGRDPLSYAGVNTRGLRRRGFSSETIHQIQDAYRYLYLRGMNFRNALAAIREELPDTPEREEILRFVAGSERGIMRGYQFLDRTRARSAAPVDAD